MRVSREVRRRNPAGGLRWDQTKNRRRWRTAGCQTGPFNDPEGDKDYLGTVKTVSDPPSSV